MRKCVVHQRIRSHEVIRVHEDNFILIEEFLLPRIIITMFADEDIPAIDDFSPIIILGDLCFAIKNQGIGGKHCLVINQLNIAPDTGDLGIPVIFQGIPEDIHCIADLYMDITKGEDIIFCIV